MLSQDTRTTLVIGHPGHELRVFRWLEINRPWVFVLTDGSGRSGRSRLASTTRILDEVGARKGSFYGRFTDVAAYSAILSHDCAVFAGLARELARHLIDQRINYVAGDALEGYNPTHDVCRLVIGAAVEMANRSGDHKARNFDFPLAAPPDNYSEAHGDQALRIAVDDRAFARKMSAARAYSELASEVETAINDNKEEAFRVECLRPVSNCERGDRFAAAPPYYEQHCEKQVAAGYYTHVIRYRQHFLPLAEALWRRVEEGI